MFEGICRLREADLVFPRLLYAIPMLFCLAYLTRRAGSTVAQVFGLRGAPIRQVLVSSLLLMIFGLVLVSVAAVLFDVLGWDTGTEVTEEAAEIASSWSVFVDSTVWTGVCEELWFRALLFTSLRTRLGVGASAAITAAAFAGVHTPNPIGALGIYFLDALLNSFWYERTRSLWPNIISHTLHNTLVTVLAAG